MRRKTAALVVLLIVIVAALSTAYLLFSSAPNYTTDVNRATNYLAAGYDRSIGLVSETPGGQTYYVYSDNFLVAYVFDKSLNATLRTMASNITSTDDRYLAKLHNPDNQYEVIASTNGTFFASSDYTLAHMGSAVIKVTLNNGTGTLSPADYADLAFLEALYFHKVNGTGAAVQDFNLGMKLYDGTGFKDKAFNGTYQTYKLALCDYVGKVLGMSVPATVESNLVRMQDASGGFFTGYGPTFSTEGTTTNTETTSLAILALGTAKA